MQHTKSLYRRFAILIFIGFPAERSPACIKYAVLQTNCGLVIVNDPNRFSFERLPPKLRMRRFPCSARSRKKIGFSRQEANESGGIFVRRVRKSLKKPFRPRPAVFGRPPSIFGTHFAITSINCGTATAVRFLHLFKFGLVVLGGQPPGAAGNRDDSLLFFCVSRNAEPDRKRGNRPSPPKTRFLSGRVRTPP